MSAQPKQFEGPALEPLLERIHDEIGPAARIVRAERSRQGGVMGFFAHQHYRLEVQPPPDGTDRGDTSAAGNPAATPARADRPARSKTSSPAVASSATTPTTVEATTPRPPSAPAPEAAPIDAFASLAEATLDVTELSVPAAPSTRPARRATSSPVPTSRPADPDDVTGPDPQSFDNVLRRVASGLGESPSTEAPSLPAPAQLEMSARFTDDGDVTDAVDDRDGPDTTDDGDVIDAVDDSDVTDATGDWDELDDMEDVEDLDSIFDMDTVFETDDTPELDGLDEIEEVDEVDDEVLAFRDELEAFVLPDTGTPTTSSPAPDPVDHTATAGRVDPHGASADRFRQEPGRWSFPLPVALPPLAVDPVAAWRAAPVEPGRGAAADVSTPEPTVLSRLADIGLGSPVLDAVRTGLVAGDTLEDALFAALSELPTAPPLPFRRGSLLAVVGAHDAAWPVASQLADEIGAPTVAFAALGAGGRHLNAELVARSAGEAAEKAPGWRRSSVAVVCVDAPVDRQSVQWSGSVLSAVRATAVWGVVDATAKPEDVDAWAHEVGGIDALVVQGAARTVSPAAVLRAGIPVARVDDTRANAHRWAALIHERVMTWG